MAILCMARPWKHTKTGVYYFRRVVPEALRPFVPKGDARSEYKRSLRTKEPGKAKRLYADAAAICDDYFAVLRATKEKAVTGPVVQAPSPSVAALPDGVAVPSLRTLAGELGQEVLRRNAEPPPAAAFNRSIPPGPWGSKSDPWTRHRYVLALSKRAHAPATTEEYVTTPAREFLQGRAIVLTLEQWEEFCDYAREAIDAALEALQRRYREGDTSAAPLLHRFPTMSSGTTAANSPKVSIRGLIDTWAKVRPSAKPRTRKKFARRLREFSEFIGHDDALAVVSRDLRRWRDHLTAAGRAPHTINTDCLAPVLTVFRAAASEEAIPTFPFAGSFAVKKDATRPKSRRPYEDNEAAQVLLATRKETEVEARWLPWLLAYTGARVGEVAQLRRENVKERDGVHFLQITNEGVGQSVKTQASARDVPLHPAVIKEGFLKFAATVPRGSFLFSKLSGATYERRADAGSRVYMRWLRKVVGISDPSIVSHSWRHRMEDQLRDVDAPEEVAAAITGRARGGSRAGYGKGPSLATKARWLAKISPVKMSA